MVDPVPAVEYHERTKHSPERVRADSFGLDWANEPTPFKTYVDLPSVPLADAIRPPQVPTLRAIAGPGPPFGGDRPSAEDDRPSAEGDRPSADVDGRPTEDDRPSPGSDRPPDLDAVTQFCYLSAGVTKAIERRGREHLFRAAACTGALYHVDLYLVAGDLPGLDAGVYHFEPRSLSLDVLRTGDFRGALAASAGGADDAASATGTGEAAPATGTDEAAPATRPDDAGVGGAPLTVVATSTWWRNAWKYRERTYRHAFWDSGTVLANLLAVAHALDHPARVVTGFADRAVADLLGVDPAEEGPVALVPVGRGADPSPDPPPVEPLDPGTEPLSPNPVRYDRIEGAYAASSLPDGRAVREWRARRPGRADEARGADGAREADEARGIDEAREADEAGEADRTPGAVGGRGPGDGDRVALAPVGDERAAKTPLHRTILRRGSCREYARESLNGRKVATVLDRATRGVPMDVRAPGAPPLQYVDAYCVVHAVDGVEPGVYQYHPAGGDRPSGGDRASEGGRPSGGELELLRAGEFRADAEHLALDQALAGDAALNVYLLADLAAVTGALGDRGYRVAQLEAALAAGRLYLAAYAHRDLGATGLTFYDDAVTEFLSPRAHGQTPMFLWTLGRPAGSG